MDCFASLAMTTPVWSRPSERQPAADQCEGAGHQRAQDRSGMRLAKWLPMAMPGSEPISSDTSSPQSIEPIPVSGAGDEGQGHRMGDVGADDAHGRHLRIGMRSTVTPIAPAPTDEIETSTPSTDAERHREGGNFSIRAAFEERGCDAEQPLAKEQVTAVRMRAKPSVVVIAALVPLNRLRNAPAPERDRRGGHAARGEAAYDSPVDRVVAPCTAEPQIFVRPA